MIFKVLAPIKRIDLLEQWIIHLFNDESENHVMREKVAVQQLQNTGFATITVSHRQAVNALVTAIKPFKHDQLPGTDFTQIQCLGWYLHGSLYYARMRRCNRAKSIHQHPG
ncbi:MAG: hypothetical protein PHO08_13260 [Methylococcales bacterium]|nr:hypothetical protein [Methylococcales bacterium]